MGNQLVSSVKTVIRPIDFYLNEVPDLKFKCSLGQTQFLKVALCAHAEGDIVVKVLSHEDPSLLLEPYHRELVQLAKVTAKNFSIASFRIVEMRTNFAYMARQYVRYSLYDRLSTRPFLTDIEKAWIVYQIFRCMEWCHNENIYHGDLKLENILVTSNLWVIMSDFASYKPVRLPEDNPTFFNYFFDTSRRRCCNIAPERFNQPETVGGNQRDPPPPASAAAAAAAIDESGNIFNLFLHEDGQLTYQMDMFSLGCILAEIYSDNFLFDLGGLLTYKKRPDDMKDYLEEALEKIQNEPIRQVVANLIDLDPDRRKSCSQVLAELKTVSFFPDYFDELYRRMNHLIKLPPDSKMLYLAKNLNYCLPSIMAQNGKGILILLMAITSSMRSLKHIFCKIEAQRLICKMVLVGGGTVSPFITDRLIPYLVQCLSEKDHRVRAEAIDSITLLLEQVTRLPSSDNNLFTDYLMEKFNRCILAEKSIYVRVCMAKNIGRLSKIALNFLNQYCDQNYDEELGLLHKYFQNLVSILITDPSNCVRRVLLLTPQNCAQLCTFFGRQKTNEVILSHIITFLNDKNDFKLRISFFDNIVVIASYLGVQCSNILHPLLQQGLCDAEEIIIAKTINSIASLVEQGLIAKNVILELLREIMPLIHHPNQWIVNATIHFISNLRSHMSLVDLNTKVLPILSSFFNLDVDCFTVQLLHRSSLDRPIPRNIYELILATKDQEVLLSFFNLLETKVQQPDYDGCLLKHNALYRRLLATENMNATTERRLLPLRDLLLKIYRNKRNLPNRHQQQQEVFSIITLTNYDLIRAKEIQLAGPDRDHVGGVAGASSANQEWLHMFGPNTTTTTTGMSQQQSAAIISGFNSSTAPGGGGGGVVIPKFQDTMDPIGDGNKFFECPPYLRDIGMLEHHKRASFRTYNLTKPLRYQANRPRGFLVSHLYEHTDSVNRMAVLGDTNMFVTSSDDGSIRLWDVCDDPNRYVITRSKYQFNMKAPNNLSFSFKSVINCGRYIVTYSNCDGRVYAFVLAESELICHCSFRVPGFTSKGPAGSGKVSLLISSLCVLSDTMFAISLTDSTIYVYDVRQFDGPFFNVPVMKMQTPPVQRVITSTDGNALVLFASTAHGYITGFDLRFQLKISQYVYSAKEKSRIAQIKYTPIGLLSSAYGNLDVTLWDFKFGQKSKILSPFQKTESTNPGLVINAMLPIMSSESSMSIITGGSDMRIRYWDLQQPEQSYIISDPMYRACNYCLTKPNNKQSPASGKSGTAAAAAAAASKNTTTTTNNGQQLATYRAINQKDGTVKIQETENVSSFQYQQNLHHCSLDQQLISFAHQDSITDLIMVNQYMVSSGRNGAVKVWR